jgi:hypothetical protein
MTKHTPGPWQVSDTELTNKGFPTKHPHFEIASENSITWIAHVLCFSDAYDENTQYAANARLIAAAPDMADILLRAYTHVSHGGPTRGELEDVLKKAGLL